MSECEKYTNGNSYLSMIQSTAEGRGNERRVYKVMKESCENGMRRMMTEWRTNDVQNETNNDGMEMKKKIRVLHYTCI